ncbi:MAG: hypothetical protein V1729_00450 [Candidatus Woesearchaeota archaeon]
MYWMLGSDVMDLDRMILVPTKSRYELEVGRYGSESAAREMFGSEEVWDYICGSHHAQKDNLAQVLKGLDDPYVIDRSQLTQDMIHDHDLFVFLGGDNHFTYCAQDILRYVQQNPGDDKLVSGIVLDPGKSAGALLYLDVDSFLGSIPLIRRDEFDVEHWTALEVKISGGSGATRPFPAVCDYFIGEYGRLFMSRNRVYIDGKEVFPDKSSGILIATGAGSCRGSWYDNIHNVMFGESDCFANDADCASIILTEHASKSKATLHKGQKFVIDSYNDAKGIIAPDSHEEHAAGFMIGCRAEIRISEYHLSIMKPGNPSI